MAAFERCSTQRAGGAHRAARAAHGDRGGLRAGGRGVPAGGCEAGRPALLTALGQSIKKAGFRGCARSTAGATLGAALHRWRSLADITETRVIGDARRATAEKGERPLEAAADALAGALALDDVPIEHDS